MEYCARCVYPENAKPTILIDDDGICSGCRVHETKSKQENINWEEREKLLREILEEYKAKAREAGSIYDCIIPVSGGKDSTYQVYLVKEVYGLNPLLVTYNHIFNTQLGIRNLSNVVKQFNCDLIRFTAKPDSVRKIDRYMLKKVGDITWHYHTGIFTFPFQIAVKFKIPLMIWGEHGYSEMTGMFRLEDIPEFTKWCRQEYEMRGVEIDDLLADESSGITLQDVAPYLFPEDEEMESVGVRGIYIGNYIKWDHMAQTQFLMDKYGFKIASWKRERTFSLFHKLDDHANDVHDYLKYLKFGYGRGSDHSCHEIRNGTMTREEGIKLATEYDPVRPKSLDVYLDFLGMTEQEFEDSIEHMRDLDIWEKDGNGIWRTKDSVANHVNDPKVEAARLPMVPEDERTFGKNNLHLYWSDKYRKPPQDADQYIARDSDNEFIIL